MTTRPLCFIDCETDGIHPGRQAWEIAIIRRNAPHGPKGRDVVTEFFVELDLSTSDPMGLRIGGFYDRHPVGRWLAEEPGIGRVEVSDGGGPISATTHGGEPLALSAGAAAAEIARVTHGATLVGAVPSFDAETFAALLHRQGLTPAWHHRLRCVESMTAGHLRLLDTGGLSDCADALGIEHPDAHTALGDARTAMAIWDHIMGGAA